VKQRDVSRTVERVRRTFTLGASQSRELGIREMEAVHRIHDRSSRQRREQGLSQRRLAAAGRPHQPQQLALPVGKQVFQTRKKRSSDHGRHDDDARRTRCALSKVGHWTGVGPQSPL